MDAPEIWLFVEGAFFHRMSEARTVISVGFFTLMKNHGIVGWVGEDLSEAWEEAGWKILGSDHSEQGRKSTPRMIGRITWERISWEWLAPDKNRKFFPWGRDLRSTDSIQIQMGSDME